jgi:hypothetical protein
MRPTARGLGIVGLVLLLGTAGAASLTGQDPRDAQVARAFREFDATRRQELLVHALDPTAGPLRGAWPVGVSLLAQTLIEEGKDSVAAAWLRWAVRLSPDLQPDTVLFLPEVVAAHRSARAFVIGSSAAADSVVLTSWLWPTGTSGEQGGHLQVASSGLVPVGVEVRGVGPIGAGANVPCNAGSYQIIATAAGNDTVEVTREVLPGVTTVLEFRLHAAVAQVATQPPALPPPMPPRSHRKKGFPVIWAGVAVAGAVALLALLAARATEPPAQTGGIVVTFPNP